MSSQQQSVADDLEEIESRIAAVGDDLRSSGLEITAAELDDIAAEVAAARISTERGDRDGE